MLGVQWKKWKKLGYFFVLSFFLRTSMNLFLMVGSCWRFSAAKDADWGIKERAEDKNCQRRTLPERRQRGESRVDVGSAKFPLFFSMGFEISFFFSGVSYGFFAVFRFACFFKVSSTEPLSHFQHDLVRQKRYEAECSRASGGLQLRWWRNQHVWHGRIYPKKLNCFVGFAFIKSIWVQGIFTCIIPVEFPMWRSGYNPNRIATKILDFELPRLPELQCAQLLEVKKFSWNSDVLGTACDRRGCWFVSHAKFNSHSLGEFLCKKRCAFGRCCDYGDWENIFFQDVWKNWTFS